jgi:tripartite-type tricarboxylate transporter receptor subunit TctC
MRLKWMLALPALFAGAGGWAQAQDSAQNYPQRSIRVIVPFAPGGAADILARIAIQQAGDDTGWRFAVENMTGAGGMVGGTAAARSAADGYTLLFCNLACAANQFLTDNPSWSPTKDLAPLIVIGTVPNILVVNAKVPAQNLAEFIALARAQPDSFAFASSGPGSSSQLTGELFKAKANVKIRDVPYRGSAAALPDIVAGRVDGMVMGLPESISFVRGGQLRALGLTSEKRVRSLPDVPTLAEAGLPDYKFVGWLSFFVPAGTPQPVIAKLNAALNQALKSPRLVQRFADADIEAVGGPPELAGRLMEEDVALWGDLIRSRGLRPSEPAK